MRIPPTVLSGLIAIPLMMLAMFERPVRAIDEPAPAEDEAPPENKTGVPSSFDEARGRARLLHETLHGVLQVMHRDFFDDESTHRIPSRSLEDVFAELAREHKVSVRWLAVNAEALNIDHKPRSEFERNAVDALKAGKPEYELREKGVYRFAGAIRLSSQCLKCHLPNRTSTKDRAAGLVISIPMQK